MNCFCGFSDLFNKLCQIVPSGGRCCDYDNWLFLNKVFLYVIFKHGHPSNHLAYSETLVGMYRYVIFDTFVRNMMNGNRQEVYYIKR